MTRTVNTSTALGAALKWIFPADTATLPYTDEASGIVVTAGSSAAINNGAPGIGPLAAEPSFGPIGINSGFRTNSSPAGITYPMTLAIKYVINASPTGTETIFTLSKFSDRLASIQFVNGPRIQGVVRSGTAFGTMQAPLLGSYAGVHNLALIITSTTQRAFYYDGVIYIDSSGTAIDFLAAPTYDKIGVGLSYDDTGAPLVGSNGFMGWAAIFNIAATQAQLDGYFADPAGTVFAPTATPPSISVQPTSQSVTAPLPATFSVTASSANTISYQWQRNPGGVGAFANVVGGTGGTTATYTTVATSVTGGSANNTDQYRVLVTDINGTTTSNAVTLTASNPTAPGISVQPANQVVTAPAQATFSVTATGTGLTYQWQRQPSGTLTFTDIAGATAAVYTTLATSVTGGNVNNGDAYRVNVTNLGGTTTSNSATVTVNAPADITPPVQTGNISVTNIASTSYTLTWPLATDNVGVAGYEYSLNGGTSYTSAGNVLTVNITGRTSGSTDNVLVRAYDAAGNRSTPALSTTVVLAVTTLVTDVLENLSGSLLLGLPVYYSWYPNGRIGILTGITPVEGTAVTDGVTGTLTIRGLPVGSGILMTCYWGATPDLDVVHYQAGTVV